MKGFGPLLRFQLEGSMGHFKKYYSNISSLTYEIPPRTVIMGLIASILEKPRDSYYSLLHPDRCKIGVSVLSPARKLMQCMNYVVKDGGHTQVRLELLLPLEDKLRYQIFLTHEDSDVVNQLSEKLNQNDPGYGLYLGQRQFRARANSPEIIDSKDVRVRENVDTTLNTLTHEENIIDSNPEGDFSLDIASVSMPISMRKAEKGREPEDLGMMVFERQGNPVPGSFQQIVSVNDNDISFFTLV